MATIKNIAGVGGNSAFTPTTKLAGMWPVTNGTTTTDNTIIDTRTGVGTTLKTKGTNAVSAGFWGTSGRGTFGATNDFFGNPSFTEYELGGETTSWIFSFRINIAIAGTQTDTIMAKRNQGTGDGNKISVFNSVVRHTYRTEPGISQILQAATDITDGNDHHVILAVDRTANRNFYVNGALDYSAGEQDMTASAMLGDATTADTNFIIGGEGAIEGTVNTPLYDGSTIVQLWDTHLYMTTGALPSNLDDIVQYLAGNIYSPIPASLW